MIRLLSKLLNIRASEWPRVSMLYAMIFLATTGIIWGETIVSAALLNQVGVGFLPWFFVAKAVISLPATMAYAAFADRAPNGRLLIAILGVAVAGIVAGVLLLGWGLAALAYPLLYLLLFVPLDDILATHWYTYVGGFYDSRAARRVVPFISTGTRISGIVAGLTMPVLTRVLPPMGIILVWLATLLVMALLVWLLPRALHDPPAARSVAAGRAPAEEQQGPFLANICEGYRFVAQSSYLRWMALSTLLLMALLTLLEYRGSQILLAELKTTEGIANFVGTLNGVGNMIILPIKLFLLSRIINRIGLSNASLIYPAGDLLAAGALLLAPGLATAAISHVDRNVALPAFRSPLDSLLYNAAPLRVKARARAFVGGLVAPLGGLLGGLALSALPLVPIPWLLAALIGAASVGYAAAALVVRRKHARALITLLEQEDYSFLLSGEATQLSVADPATLGRLKRKLEESASAEMTIFIAKLIGEVGGAEAHSILSQSAHASPDARVRAGILDVLAATEARGEAVRQLYVDLLADPDGAVRQAAINGLEQLAGPDSEVFLAHALGMLRDPDARVRMQVLAELAQSRRFFALPAAVAELERALGAADPSQRAQAVHILGLSGDSRAARRLIGFLDDAADVVRLEAALAAERWALRGLPAEVAELAGTKMVGRAHDPIERVRQAALAILGRIGTYDAHQALASALADPSIQIRSAAIEALVGLGKAAVPCVHPLLDAHDQQTRKMAAVVLGRVNRHEFGGLITAHVAGNLLTIYTNAWRLEALDGCDAYPSLAVLRSAVREKNQALLDEIFFLLKATHDPAAIDAIAATLRSDDAAVRANAAEAIESLTTPQTATLIAALCEPDTRPAALLRLGETTWNMRRHSASQAIQQLAADAHAPLLRAITAFALGEIGAKQAAAPAPTATPVRAGAHAETGQRHGRRHSGAADLLDRLAGIAKEIVAEADIPAATAEPTPANVPDWLRRDEIDALLATALADPADEVRGAAQAARRQLDSPTARDDSACQEKCMLSTIEKIIFLKEVPFFRGMTIEQLKVLATVGEEEFFAEDTRVFSAGDAGGTLYIVISGRIGIEQEKRKGSFARVATVEAHSYFGESDLFDDSPRSANAIALQDTLALRLRREPLIALARQHPDLSLELINVLSQRLREANDRVADLTRTRPRELHKLFDKYE
jgi:HEAT repeat protein